MHISIIFLVFWMVVLFVSAESPPPETAESAMRCVATVPTTEGVGDSTRAGSDNAPRPPRLREKPKNLSSQGTDADQHAKAAEFISAESPRTDPDDNASTYETDDGDF